MANKTQLTRLGLFDAKVPRYTSYPTAPHFSAQLGANDFTNWVGAITPGTQISLYLHVPFCRRLCWFCACRTQGTQTQAPLRAYLDTLKTEISMLRAILPDGVTLSRLHWGGGTPTLLAPDMIRELAGAVGDLAPFSAAAEFSVEIDPNEIDEARADALAEVGMNRASIGIQDFDPEIQKIIGREQSYEITAAAADMLRARGIHSLNADILFGLPNQTGEKITQSVQKLLSLAPDRVALYGYAHVPWMAKRQQMIPSDSLPTPQERLALFEIAQKLLAWDGYDAIGIDHFALPQDGLAKAKAAGKLRRNFQGYTDDPADVLIGLGASSISRFPQGYAQNAPATSAYAKTIEDGSFATARGHRFSHEDIRRARMIEAIMCDFAISRAEMIDSYGMDPKELEAEFQSIRTEFEGLVDVTPDGLFIPPKSRALTRIIARSFDAYDLSKAGHSSAI